MRWSALGRALLATAVALCLAGCNRQEAHLQQHQVSFESLGATTGSITRAWLAGDVSGTYAGTALEQTLSLVEQERRALTAAPEMLQDARGASLSQAAEHLSRVIASLIGDVKGRDGSGARTHLAEIPIEPPSQSPS